MERHTHLEFDYLVVGSGSAGAIVAHNLAFASDATVALLESGPFREDSLTSVPLNYMEMLHKGTYHWPFVSDSVPALENRTIAYPRGKVVGGCSAVNALVYVIGHRQDYENWRSASHRFGWDNALDALRAIEHSTDPSRGRGSPHGRMKTTELQPDLLSSWFLESCALKGIPHTRDYNDGGLEGCGMFQLNTNQGRRFHVLDGYIRPALQRKNFTLLSECTVKRVRFVRNRAHHVEVILAGKPVLVGIRCGLVLSCGAIGTPQLLEVSGVGDSRRLEQLGIEMVVHQRGVGENLQDHVGVRLDHPIRSGLGWNHLLNDPQTTRKLQEQHQFSGSGPYSIASSSATAFFRSDDTQPISNMQFHFMTYSANQVGAGFHPHSGLTTSVCLLRPESSGHVHIREKDVAVAPHIQPRFFHEHGDLVKLKAGFEKLLSLFEHTPLGACAIDFDTTLRRFTDRAIEDYIRSSAFSLYHPTSTCRMGEDDMSPVSQDFRLKGIDNVWVVDASVMPAVPGANTHAPAMIVGEIGSRAIVENEKLRSIQHA